MATPDEDAVRKFELGVMSHVSGTLLAWALAGIAYLMYLLWRDYISTILIAFIVSQTLHTQRAQLVGLVRWVRDRNTPPLFQCAVTAVARPRSLLNATLFGLPSVVQLAMLQLVFLIGFELSTWLRLSYLALPTALVGAVTVFLFDKKLLSFNFLLSDELFAASVVLVGMIVVLCFVIMTLSVQSVVDGVELLAAGSSLVGSLSSDAAVPVRQVVSQGVEVGRAGLDQLRQAEYQWVPVLSHLMDHVNRSASEGTALLMSDEVVHSTFDKLRECYPNAAWLGQAEDLGKLVLWAANQSVGSSASPFSANSSLLEEGRKLFSELDDPAELLTMLQAQMAALVAYLPQTETGLLYLVSSILAKSLQLVNVLINVGGTAVVFLTMTFYMLASEKDVLTLVVDKVHPAATQEALQRMRDTIDAIIIMPIAGAARNAMITELFYYVLGVPCRHLAALGVVVFTLFPLAYAWVVSLPWVLVCCFVLGKWISGVLCVRARVIGLC